MARTQSIGIREQLNALVPPRRLAELARETGAVQRQRKVEIKDLFWVLVLGFGAGTVRTFAGLRRMFEAAARQRIAPSAFWDRFTPALARFVKRVAVETMREVSEPERELRGCLASFKDAVVTDSTVIRLHEMLAKSFPATRTNHTKAAAKLHVVTSVAGAGPRSVKITSERAGDGKTLQVGPWVKGRLMMFDLGYYRFQLFDCIRRNGGFFISRLKTSANPEIVSSNCRHRGQAVDVEGQRLQDVLPRLKRQALDVTVKILFKRRVYAGKSTSTTTTFRLVGVLDQETNDYHLYLTNIPPERLSAEEVALCYRARWYIEQLFAELKSGYGLDELPTRKRAAIETFIFTALITLMASRRLLAEVRCKFKSEAQRVGRLRWARVFRTYASQILLLLLAPPRHGRFLASALEASMLHEALDPHVRRPGLVEQVENGTSWVAARA